MGDLGECLLYLHSLVSCPHYVRAAWGHVIACEPVESATLYGCFILHFFCTPKAIRDSVTFQGSMECTGFSSVTVEISLALSLHPFVSFCRYFINLCQRVYKGPLDCSERASICKKSATGQVQVLGLVHTQKLEVIGKALGFVLGSVAASRLAR